MRKGNQRCRMGVGMVAIVTPCAWACCGNGRCPIICMTKHPQPTCPPVHPPRLHAARGLRGAAAARAQGVHGDLSQRVRALRAREWKDKSSYTMACMAPLPPTSWRERPPPGGRPAMPAGAQRSGGDCHRPLALLRQGDEVPIPTTPMARTRALAEVELRHYGIAHRIYDPPIPLTSPPRSPTPRNSAVWLEAPASVDAGVSRSARTGAHLPARGVTSVLIEHPGARPPSHPLTMGDGQLGADISVHALTKYPQWRRRRCDVHGITTRDEALHLRISSRICAWAWAWGQ